MALKKLRALLQNHKNWGSLLVKNDGACREGGTMVDISYRIFDLVVTTNSLTKTAEIVHLTLSIGRASSASASVWRMPRISSRT